MVISIIFTKTLSFILCKAPFKLQTFFRTELIPVCTGCPNDKVQKLIQFSQTQLIITLYYPNYYPINLCIRFGTSSCFEMKLDHSQNSNVGHSNSDKICWPYCSNALTFRIFADDTNVFASARNLKDLEEIVNSELKKVKIWCDVNRLSINFTKTNFMIIKSSKKKDDQVGIKIESADGTINVLQRKQKIKYLGVLLDETMSFNHHISYICTRIARNNGIISKLRHYLTLLQMKQIYYSLIYPYISYAILAWGSAYKTHIDKIQVKQNHSARLIFFATTYGEHTESSLPLLNLLDVLTVHNVYRFRILKFTYLWHKGLLPKLFSNYFQYASNVHKYNTRYASKQNLYVKKVRTNTGKQTIGYAACTIWDKIPITLKELNTYQFQKQLKPYLLSEQHS